MEDLKQKIHKKKKLKNKLIKDVQKLMPNFDTELLTKRTAELCEACEPVSVAKRSVKIEAENIIDIEPELPSNVVKFEKIKKQSPRQVQMNKPTFYSDFEKAEWLQQNGCTNNDDRAWLESYLKSDEYNNLYGGDL